MYVSKYITWTTVLEFDICKNLNEVLFMLRMTGLIKLGYNPNKSSFSTLLHTQILDWVELRKNEIIQNCGKKESQILDMLFIELFRFTDQNFLAGAVGAHPLLAPGVKALKMTFLPILGQKNFKIPKFFFLQISLFMGPIDGTNDIFLSGLPFRLYSNS